MDIPKQTSVTNRAAISYCVIHLLEEAADVFAVVVAAVDDDPDDVDDDDDDGDDEAAKSMLPLTKPETVMPVPLEQVEEGMVVLVSTRSEHWYYFRVSPA